MGTTSISKTRYQNDDRRYIKRRCACGCGKEINEYTFSYAPSLDRYSVYKRKFVKGHNALRGVPRTQEVKDKVRKSVLKWHREVGHSKETIEKIRQTILKQRDKISRRQMGKNNSMYGKTHSDEYKKRLSVEMRREGSPSWKGDGVGIKALHRWIKRNKPKPKVCEICNLEKDLELSNKGHTYKRNLEDWQWVCRKCHRKYDPKNMGYLKRKRNRGRFI